MLALLYIALTMTNKHKQTCSLKGWIAFKWPLKLTQFEVGKYTNKQKWPQVESLLSVHCGTQFEVEKNNNKILLPIQV